MIVLGTVKGFEDVQSTQSHIFEKGSRMIEIFRDVFGDGMIAVDHSHWAFQRKSLAHMFNMDVFSRVLMKILQTHTLALGSILRSAARTPEKSLNEGVDIDKLLQWWAFDVFTEFVFEIPTDSLASQQDHPIMSALDEASKCTAARFSQPDWAWKLMRFLNIGSEKILRQNIAILNGEARKITTEALEKNKREMDENPSSKQKTALSLMVQQEILQSGKEEDRIKVTPTYFRDVSITLLMAGKDTVALALTWFIVMLNRNPHVEENIRMELRRELPDLFIKEEFVPNETHIRSLVYLDATIRESLRLHPPAPFNWREANDDTTLSDGTFVAKGTLVCTPPYTIGRMEHVWGLDVLKCKPERWLEVDPSDTSKQKIRDVSPFQFNAFLGGPRRCLGYLLAMAQMKILMAYLLSKYHLQTTEDPHSYTYSLAMTSSFDKPVLVNVFRNQPPTL